MSSIRLLLSALLASCSFVACSDESGDSSNLLVNDDEVVIAHIDVVRQRIAANNAEDWDTWESLHTTDAVRTAPALPGPLVGAAAMRAGIEELFTTFPDYHLELVEAFGDGDQIVARIHTRATMLGPMQLGETLVPATGMVFEQDWVAMLRFEGDRIASIDEFYDNYDVLIQLGLGESP